LHTNENTLKVYMNNLMKLLFIFIHLPYFSEILKMWQIL